MVEILQSAFRISGFLTNENFKRLVGVFERFSRNGLETVTEDNNSNWTQTLRVAIRERRVDKILAALAPLLSGLIGLLLTIQAYIPFFPYVIGLLIAMSLVSGFWLLAIILTRTPPTLETEEAASQKPEVSAARGGWPFLREQGVLFSSLERRNEIQDVLAKLSEDTAIVLLHGKAHAGKTSILRAGILPQLRDAQVKHLYWHAGASDNLNRFRQALREAEIDLGTDLTDFSSLKDSKVVIIMDQFELIHKSDLADKPFFDFLAAVSHEHPRRLQLLVALREENVKDWDELENHGIYADQRFPVDFLPLPAARRAIETILSAARVQLRRKVLSDYTANVATNSHVCPLYIGIGARVFADRVSSSGQSYVSWGSYVAAGGAFGVLVEYIEKWLKGCNLSKADQKAFIDALVNNTGVAKSTGATFEEIIEGITKASALPREIVASCVRALSAPGLGLLEEVAHGGIRYRFSSQQFVSILRHLTQELPPALNDLPASNVILDRYARWQGTNRDSRFLLNRGLLQQVGKIRQDLVKGDPSFAKYLRSSRLASWHLRIIMACSLILAIAGWSGFKLGTPTFQHHHLIQWQLPPELYDRQEQFKRLLIDSRSMDGVGWLRSRSLEQLEIRGSILASLDGIERLAGLRTLTLDLTESKLNNLAPVSRLSELRTLTLYLGKSNISDLKDLSQLTKLENLTLQIRASSLRALDDLGKLSSLHTLKLEMEESQISMLADLRQLPKLRNLTLTITESSSVHDPFTINIVKTPNVANLRLPEQIESLTLNLQKSYATELPSLTQVSRLKQLVLQLEGSSILNLPDLSSLTALQSLVIDVSNTAIGSFPNLSLPPNLINLTLHIDGSEVSELPNLPNLPRQLKVLHLDAKSSELVRLSGNNSLQQLQDLKDLEFHVTKNRKAVELVALSRLLHLTTLILYTDWPQLDLLPDLAPLHDLHNVTLYLDGTATDTLPSFKQFHDIRTFALHLEGSQAQQLPNLSHFQELSTLILDLHGSQINRLPDLKEFPELRNLTLNLDSSAIQNLDPLNQLIRFHQLQNLELNVAGLSLPELPNLTELNCLQTNLDLRKTSLTNLVQLRGLSNIKALTVGREVLSLAEMPQSVQTVQITW